MSYDALRRVLSIARAGQTNATLSYDRQDNVVSVKDARKHTTKSVFDDFGNERSVSSPDSGKTTSVYDAAGNLVSQTNAKNETATLEWDALNRPVRVSWPNAQRDTVLTWDTVRTGELSGVQEEEFERAFAYDALGRVTSESVSRAGTSFSFSVGYGYDATTGDLVSMTYPSGAVIQFTRDGNGQVSAVQAGGVSLATGIARLPFGPMRSMNLRGGALPLTRTFDQRYQLTRIQAGAVDMQYTRDLAGQVTGVTGIGEPSLVAGTEASTINSANNRMTARGSVKYTYDAVGNRTSDGTRTYVWDALGRLKEVRQGSQVIATYGYDIQNRRVRKTVGTETTYYLYNLDDQLIAEISGTGTVLREYVWLEGEPFVLCEYTGANAGNYFYLNDHLGTPQRLVNGQTGAVAWQAAYLPFGEAQVSNSSTVTNNLRFPGQYYDAETGLHYNWNRYYDPASGRYVSADPIGLEGGLNLYVYVNNNPINLKDISGLITRYSCFDDCPGGVWDIDLGINSSLVIFTGANISRVTFTCLSNNKKCTGLITCGVIGFLADISIMGISIDFQYLGTGRRISNYYSYDSIKNYHSQSTIITTPFGGTSGNNINIGIGVSAGIGLQSCTAESIVCDE